MNKPIAYPIHHTSSTPSQQPENNRWIEFDSHNRIALFDDHRGLSVGFGMRFIRTTRAFDDDQLKLLNLIERLPGGTVLQMGQHVTHCDPAVLDDWARATCKGTENSLFHHLAERRATFFKTLCVNGELRQMRCYAFLQVPLSLNNPAHATLHNEWIAQGSHFTDLVEQYLKGIGLDGLLMDATSLNDLLDILSGAKDGAHPPRAHARLTTDGRVADLQQFKWLTQPQSLSKQLPPYFLYSTIRTIDSTKNHAQILRRVALLSPLSLVGAPWIRSTFSSAFACQEHAQYLLEYSVRGQAVVQLHAGIYLYGACGNTEHFRATLEKLGEQHACAISFESFTADKALMPFPTQPVSMLKKHIVSAVDTMTSGARAVTALPIHSDCSRTISSDRLSPHQPIFITRQGLIASLDLFHNSPEHSHFVMTAASGSGRAFLLYEFVRSILSTQGFVTIVDSMGNFAHLAKVFNGVIHRLTPELPRSMNPFWALPADETGIAPDAKTVSLLKQLITQLLGAAWQEKAQLWFEAFLDSAIISIWQQHGEQLELHHLHDYCLAFARTHNEPRVRYFAEALKPFAIGEYAAWFNGAPAVEEASDFRVFDTEHLYYSKPQLKAALMPLLFLKLMRDVRTKPTTTKKFFLFDDACDALGHIDSGMIDELYRCARALNTTVGVLSSNFGDFVDSPTLKMVFQKSPWKFILSNSPRSIEMALRHRMLTGNDEVDRALTAVQPGANYMEFGFTHYHHHGILRLVLDPYASALYSTLPPAVDSSERL